MLGMPDLPTPLSVTDAYLAAVLGELRQIRSELEKQSQSLGELQKIRTELAKPQLIQMDAGAMELREPARIPELVKALENAPRPKPKAKKGR